MKKNFVLAICLIQCLLLVLVGCQKQAASQAEVKEVIKYVEKPTAGVSGLIKVPRDFDADSITIFAEGTSYIALTDWKGGFVLSGLKPGNYVIRATRHDLETIKLGDIEIAESDLEKEQPFMSLGEFTMPPKKIRTASGEIVEGFGMIRGQILTTDPVASSGVLVEALGTEFRTVTDGYGSYAFPNVPAGEYTLRFSKPSYGAETTEVNVVARQVTNVPDTILNVVDAAAIGGRSIIGAVSMLDANGEKVEQFGDVRIYLEGTQYSLTPTSNGSFQFKALEPGIYTVGASAANFTLEQSQRVSLFDLATAEVQLVLTASENTTGANSIASGRIELEEPPATGNAGVAVSLAGTNAVAITDPSGSFQLMNVPEGTFMLIASLNGYETGVLENIEIPANATIELPVLRLKREVIPPAVLATSPEEGARDISIENPTLAVIVFDQAMNPETLRSAISITPEVEYRVFVGGEHALSGDDRLAIEMSGYTRTGAPMKFDTQYKITVSETASSQTGVPMGEAFSMQFTTGKAKVIATWPPDNSENAAVREALPLKIDFNAGIDIERFDSSELRIRPELVANPNFYVRDDPTTGWSSLYIQGMFEPDTEYEVTLRGGLRTFTNDRVSNVPYTFTFRTQKRYEAKNRFDSLDRREREREERDRK